MQTFGRKSAMEAVCTYLAESQSPAVDSMGRVGGGEGEAGAILTRLTRVRTNGELGFGFGAGG